MLIFISVLRTVLDTMRCDLTRASLRGHRDRRGQGAGGTKGLYLSALLTELNWINFIIICLIVV